MPRASPRHAALLLALLVLPLALWTPAVGAHAVGSGGSLPAALSGSVALAHGTDVYLLGGRTSAGVTGAVLRYDTLTGVVTDTGALIPAREHHAAAISDAGVIYVFGGITAAGVHLADVVSYDPATNAVQTLNATMPRGLYNTAAAFAAGRAFVFGGADGTQAYDTILRFDPATGVLDTLNVTLPRQRNAIAAAADPLTGSVYLVGGINGGVWTYSRDVLRFDAVNLTVSDTGALLPYDYGNPNGGRLDIAAAIDPVARSLTLFGGYVGGSCSFAYTSQVLLHTLGTTTVSVHAHASRGFSNAAAAHVDGTSYSFGGNDCYGPNSLIVKHARPPPTPEAPTASASRGPGPGNITVSWTTPYDGGHPITSYTVHRRAPNLTWVPVATVDASLNTYLDTGLGDGVTHAYAVLATNAYGPGPLSNAATATTEPAPTPPSAPYAYAWRGPAAGQITVMWDAPWYDGGRPITSYTIHRLEQNATNWTWAPIATVNASEWSYVDAGLGPNATREYYVTAQNVVGSGAPSNVVSATTFATPTPPGNLTATRPTLATIRVAWDAPVDDGGLPVEEYRVYRKRSPNADGVGGTDYALVATVSASTRAYTDTPLPGEYTYRVTAVSDAGESAPSGSATQVATANAVVQT